MDTCDYLCLQRLEDGEGDLDSYVSVGCPSGLRSGWQE